MISVTSKSSPGSTWAPLQIDAALPAWSVDYSEENDGAAVWPPLSEADVDCQNSISAGDPSPENARSNEPDGYFPYIAGSTEDTSSFASHWKSAFYGQHTPAPDESYQYLSEEAVRKPPSYPFVSGHHYYPQSPFDGEYTNSGLDGYSQAHDFKHTGGLFLSGDVSPAQLSPSLPLSRQTTNESFTTCSPLYSAHEETPGATEEPMSEARSSLRQHMEKVEVKSDSANTKAPSLRRRSMQRSRKHSTGNLSSSSTPRRNSTTEKNHIVCPLCNKVFQRDLARHLRTHETTARFICPFPREECAHKRGQFNRGYDFKKHLLHYHFVFSDPNTARKLRDLNGKLSFQGRCCCGIDHEFDAEEWLDEHISCDPPKCPLLKGRTKEVVLKEAMERAAAEGLRMRNTQSSD